MRSRLPLGFAARCALVSLALYAALLVWGWSAVARLGDDGIRVRPVSHTGLVVTAVLPGSSAVGKDLTAGGAAIVGVDGLITRDERELLRAFNARSAGRESVLNVQGILRGGGTGTGLGRSREVTVALRPRLFTPVVGAGLLLVSAAGAASLGAAALVARNSTHRRVAWSTLVTGCAVAGLMLTRLLAEIDYAARLLAPPLLVVLVVALVALLGAQCSRRLAAATVVAFIGCLCALLLHVSPPTTLDPRLIALGFDAGIALLALVPLAVAPLPVLSFSPRTSHELRDGPLPASGAAV